MAKGVGAVGATDWSGPDWGAVGHCQVLLSAMACLALGGCDPLGQSAFMGLALRHN